MKTAQESADIAQLQEKVIELERVVTELAEKIEALEAGTGVNGATKLSNLEDVKIINPEIGHVLRYDGSKWINSSADHSVNWNNVINKPVYYPTNWIGEYIANKPIINDDPNITVNWSQINNKPSEFPTTWTLVANRPLMENYLLKAGDTATGQITFNSGIISNEISAFSKGITVNGVTNLVNNTTALSVNSDKVNVTGSLVASNEVACYGSGKFELTYPVAGVDALGMIKVGKGLAISNGVLSVI